MSDHRDTTDPVPLPASPRRADAIVPPGPGTTAGVGGMPVTTTSGVQARQDEKADATLDTVHPAEPGSEAGDRTGAATQSTPAAATGAAGRGEHGAEHGHDDGLLDSIGKAISSPIRAAAEDDEAAQTGDKPRPPGGVPK